MLSIIPKPARPTQEQWIHMIADWSQKEEPVEIVLDEEADASLCCQHFIDFWENHFWPLVLPVDRRDPEYTEREYDQMDEKLLKGYQQMMDDLHSTNCNKVLSVFENQKILEELENNPRALARAKQRDVRDLYWILHEFNQCLKGEPFDFTDYVDLRNRRQ
jgi:hypothetical protein